MTNLQRADRAKHALLTYVGSDNSSDEESFIDLLCDLRHLADSYPLSFDALVEESLYNYEEEIEEERKVDRKGLGADDPRNDH